MKPRTVFQTLAFVVPVLAFGCGPRGTAICEPGTTLACYSGPTASEGVGLCVGGTMTCAPNGGGYGPCEGEVIPTDESCDTAGDDDCDGMANEPDAGCGCVADETTSCYTGPVGTEGVGACAPGTRTCAADGSGFGPCLGEITPGTESCDTAEDDDCDGMVNEDGNNCVCTPNMPGGTCYSGPPGTEGVGLCVAGTATCNAMGTALGPCVGEVTPVTETCATMGDDDCNGMANEGGMGCVCVPGSPLPCYTGPAGTMGVGTCAAGTQLCNAMGTGYDPCMGDIVPMFELCDGMDHDCDGIADNQPDVDGDGWIGCEGDCCEFMVQCSDPALVNPGAFEFIGNMVDDDCDPATSDTVPPAACSTTSDFTGVTPVQVAEAMDLCQFTTASPPPLMRTWGVIDVEFVTADGFTPSASELSNMMNAQSAILTGYGTGGIAPNNGPTMAGISSGWMRDEGDPGYPGVPDTGLGSYRFPPAGYLAANGGSLPSSLGCAGGCPSGSGANDSINVRLTIRVPTNAQSFSYQFRFFSYEFWDYSCTIYNDFYLALLSTGAAGIPADGNISFDSATNPVSVNNSFFEVCNMHPIYPCMNCPSGNAELAGTGMCPSWPGNCVGGGTDWLTTTAPVVPGETIVLELMVFDVSDDVLDSLALLDNFLWDINPSGVGTN